MRQPMSGAGITRVAAPPQAVWDALLDPAVLQALIPGAEQVERVGVDEYRAFLMFGVGRLRARSEARLVLSGQDPPRRLVLAGSAAFRFGAGTAKGWVALRPDVPGRTVVDWRYEGEATGPLALAGRHVLGTASGIFVAGFFRALARWAERGG